MNPKVTAEDITLEAHVAEAGRAWLKLQGWMVHRLQADRHAKGGNRKRHEREEEGTPDYICVRLSVHRLAVFYWEAKRPKNARISQSQRDWRDRHPEAKVTYAKTLDELIEFVRGNFL